jgi:isoamylase
VELCFTGEGDDTSPTVVSLRGLDNALYYRPNALLNLAQPPVPALVRDALIYWTKQHSLDGFVLLSAEAIAQSVDGTVLDAPPLAEVLATDGALRACKIVAWPRDYGLLPRHGRRGFPHAAALLQHNGAFGAVLQWLGGGGPGLLTAVATQLTGMPCQSRIEPLLVKA